MLAKTFRAVVPKRPLRVFSTSFTGSGASYKTLYEDCKESLKYCRESLKDCRANAEKYAVSAEKYAVNAEVKIAALEKNVQLLDGLLISRRIMEEIANHQHPKEYTKSVSSAIRYTATNKKFKDYLEVVGKFTGQTLHPWSSKLT